MKKLISLLLVLSMAASLAVPAGAAEDATAATMRLESTEGTVTVKNASGLSVKRQNKTRLYDGYSVKTAAKSYAYISLDGDKTLKLDASSEASVSKSGKKLEIVLVSGSLFFNVAKPLERSESLNIRTATMVTGVRGTSACVSAPNRHQTEITLLTGRLEVTGRDSHSGQIETVAMAAGERTIVAQREAGTPQERLEIQKLSAQEAELPGFAAVEVAKDPELQSRIAAETELSVSRIVEDAAERLTADETAAQQAAAEVREKLEQVKELLNTIQSAFGQTSGGGSGGGSSSGGGSTPAPVTHTVTVTYGQCQLSTNIKPGIAPPSDGTVVDTFTVEDGGTFRFSPEPNSLYAIQSIDYGDFPTASISEDDDNGTYTLTNVTRDVNIEIKTELVSCFAEYFPPAEADTGYTVEVSITGQPPDASSPSRVLASKDETVQVKVTREKDDSDAVLYDNSRMNLNNVKLNVNGKNEYSFTLDAAAGTYTATFPVNEYLAAGDETLELTLHGIQWSFDNTLPADGDRVANVLNDPATGTVNVNAWDTANNAGIDRGVTVSAWQTLNLNTDTSIVNNAILTVEGESASNSGKVQIKAGTTFTVTDGELAVTGGQVSISSITAAAATVQVGSDGTVTVGSGGTLTVSGSSTLTNDGTVEVGENGNMSVDSGCTVTNNGTLTNSGTVTSVGTLTNYNTVTNSGTLESRGTLAFESGTLKNDGELTSGGPLEFTYNMSVTNNGTLTVASGSEMTNNSRGMTVGSGGKLMVNGKLINKDSMTVDGGGELTVNGTLNLNSGGLLTVNGAATVNSGGEITLAGGGLSWDGGVLTVDNGTLTVNSGGKVTLEAVASNNRTGSLNVNSGGALENSGTLTVGGTADVNGRFLVGSGSTINVSANGKLTLSTAMEGVSGGTLTEQQITMENNAELYVAKDLPKPTFSPDSISPGATDPIFHYVNDSGSQVVATITLTPSTP